MMPVLKVLRLASAFVGNFLAALVGEAIFASEFRYIARIHTPAEQLHREYVLSAVLCLLIGYFVFWKWRSASSKWVWLAGIALFAYRAVSLWRAPPSILQPVLADQPTLAAVVRQMFDLPYVISRTPFAIALVRCVFYSAGAWICWAVCHFGRQPFRRGHAPEAQFLEN